MFEIHIAIAAGGIFYDKRKDFYRKIKKKIE